MPTLDGGSRQTVTAEIPAGGGSVKKLLMLAAAAAGVQYARKRKQAQDSSAVWKQATRP